MSGHVLGAEAQGSILPGKPPHSRLVVRAPIDSVAVLDASGARIGSVRYLMVDLCTGCVRAAVLTLGGLFPIGERFYPVPWEWLRFDVRRQVFTAEVDRRRLCRAPSYEHGTAPAWGSDYEARLRRFYGTSREPREASAT
ncbi:PRC-barrel domain containing protein [Sphingomonas parva]|uniref:PRC-barrel domain containing protein n=1 Tax=Sphingomonas parva TaxID=2555898 RepID=A0A4Y8ZRW1_9SPHN|nr:PRC-barrel domain containing protein [Sphingomonas parva]